MLRVVVLTSGLALLLATGCSSFRPARDVAPACQVSLDLTEPPSPGPVCRISLELSDESPEPEPEHPGIVPAACFRDELPCGPCLPEWTSPCCCREEKPGIIVTFLDQACDDFRHFYFSENLVYLGGGVAVAAVLANTPADQEFRDWYQDTFTPLPLESVASGAKQFGEHWYTLPIYLGAAYLGHVYDDDPTCRVVGQWGNRTLRAFLVGAPAVGVLQVGLGAGRPSEGQVSRWRPFQDSNSVAGHGFMGSVPFLTAAAMTDNRLCKAGFFAASFATPWARIHRDGHYLSQTILGWWIAYLAVKSVTATECERRSIQIFPATTGDGPGVNVLVEF